MNKQDVLAIVDACFHMFASTFRQDAKQEATEMCDRLHPDTLSKLEPGTECDSTCPFYRFKDHERIDTPLAEGAKEDE